MVDFNLFNGDTKAEKPEDQKAAAPIAKPTIASPNPMAAAPKDKSGLPPPAAGSGPAFKVAHPVIATNATTPTPAKSDAFMPHPAARPSPAATGTPQSTQAAGRPGQADAEIKVKNPPPPAIDDAFELQDDLSEQKAPERRGDWWDGAGEETNGTLSHAKPGLFSATSDRKRYAILGAVALSVCALATWGLFHWQSAVVESEEGEFASQGFVDAVPAPVPGKRDLAAKDLGATPRSKAKSSPGAAAEAPVVLQTPAPLTQQPAAAPESVVIAAPASPTYPHLSRLLVSVPALSQPSSVMTPDSKSVFMNKLGHQFPYQRYKAVLDLSRLAPGVERDELLRFALRDSQLWTRLKAAAALTASGNRLLENEVAATIGSADDGQIKRFMRRYEKSPFSLTIEDQAFLLALLPQLKDRARHATVNALLHRDLPASTYVALAAREDRDTKVRGLADAYLRKHEPASEVLTAWDEVKNSGRWPDAVSKELASSAGASGKKQDGNGISAVIEPAPAVQAKHDSEFGEVEFYNVISPADEIAVPEATETSRIKKSTH